MKVLATEETQTGVGALAKMRGISRDELIEQLLEVGLRAVEAEENTVVVRLTAADGMKLRALAKLRGLDPELQAFELIREGMDEIDRRDIELQNE